MIDNEIFNISKFAKLAKTTIRTLHWYDKKEILKPKIIKENGYRYYNVQQLHDLNTIKFLKQFGTSIDEIQKFLKSKYSLRQIFEAKLQYIENNLNKLQTDLNDIKKYNYNLDTTGFIIEEKIKCIKKFEIFYIEAVIPYAEIRNHCIKLKSYFSKISDNAVFLTIYSEDNFKPLGEKLIIGVIKEKNMKLTKEGTKFVKEKVINKYKALYYVHKGPDEIISHYWKEIKKICYHKNYKRDIQLLYGIEFYKKDHKNNYNVEIQIPIL